MFWICSQCKTFQFWNGAWGSAFVERPCSQCSAPALTPILPDFVQEEGEVQVKPKRPRKPKPKPKAAAAPAAPVAVAPVVAPAVVTPPAPKPKPMPRAAPPPAAPPAAVAAVEEEDDDGFVTAADLRRARFQDLPGPPLGEEGPDGIPANVRVAVQRPYRAQAFHVRRIRQSFVLSDAGVRTTYYTAERPGKSVKEFLTDIVSNVTTRGIHGNYGTVFRNDGNPLPRALLPAALLPGQRPLSAYVEYGFRNNNVEGGEWERYTVAGYQKAPGRVSERINDLIARRRGEGGVDLGDRIVVCQTDDTVYFTPDHYRTFFRYDAANRSWTRVP